MTRYVQGPRHARRGPHRGVALPVALLALELAAVIVLLVVIR